MITSQLVLDILDLLLDGYEDETILRQQVLHLTISDIEYTGVGVFFSFNKEKAAYNYRATHRHQFCLVDLKLYNPVLDIMGDVTIHFSDGWIDYIGILNINGRPYPYLEPEHYVLKQEWGNFKQLER